MTNTPSRHTSTGLLSLLRIAGNNVLYQMLRPYPDIAANHATSPIAVTCPFVNACGADRRNHRMDRRTDLEKASIPRALATISCSSGVLRSRPEPVQMRSQKLRMSNARSRTLEPPAAGSDFGGADAYREYVSDLQVKVKFARPSFMNTSDIAECAGTTSGDAAKYERAAKRPWLQVD